MSYIHVPLPLYNKFALGTGQNLDHHSPPRELTTNLVLCVVILLHEIDWSNPIEPGFSFHGYLCPKVALGSLIFEPLEKVSIFLRLLIDAVPVCQANMLCENLSNKT